MSRIDRNTEIKICITKRNENKKNVDDDDDDKYDDDYGRNDDSTRINKIRLR